MLEFRTTLFGEVLVDWLSSSRKHAIVIRFYTGLHKRRIKFWEDRWLAFQIFTANSFTNYLLRVASSVNTAAVYNKLPSITDGWKYGWCGRALNQIKMKVILVQRHRETRACDARYERTHRGHRRTSALLFCHSRSHDHTEEGPSHSTAQLYHIFVLTNPACSGSTYLSCLLVDTYLSIQRIMVNTLTLL